MYSNKASLSGGNFNYVLKGNMPGTNQWSSSHPARHSKWYIYGTIALSNLGETFISHQLGRIYDDKHILF